MAQFEKWIRCDLEKLPKLTILRAEAFSQDVLANRIGAQVYSHGQPVQLSGTVKGYVLLPGGTTKEISGYTSGNKAYVNLPTAVYADPGTIRVVVKLLEGDDITTLCAVEGTVVRSATNS